MRLGRWGVCLFLTGVAQPAVLVEHDYDALGDRIVATPLRAGEHLTQSFTAPATASTAAAVRLKIRRNGSPGPLQYRVGVAAGASEMGAVEIAPERIQPYFEHFVTMPLKQQNIQPGRKYFVQ